MQNNKQKTKKELSPLLNSKLKIDLVCFQKIIPIHY